MTYIAVFNQYVSNASNSFWRSCTQNNPIQICGTESKAHLDLWEKHWTK